MPLFTPFANTEPSRVTPALRLAAGAGLLLVLGLCGWAAMVWFPARFFTIEWLRGEHGNQLLRASQILQGEVPFRDFECQYGPIPLMAWAGFAALFGNTVPACVAFHLVTSLVAIGALFAWLSGLARTRCDVFKLAAIIAVASLALTVFYRNSMLLSLIPNVEYLSIERLFLILLAASWRPPQQRGWPQLLLMGTAVLGWQLSKFGGAVFGLAGFAVVDLFYFAIRRDCAVWQSLLRFWWKCALVCLVAEGLRAVFFLMLLPPEMAFREFLPLWIRESYPYNRLTLWDGLPHLLTYTAPIYVPVAAGLATLVYLAMNSKRRPEADAAFFPMLVPFFFFLLASIKGYGYFGREWLFFEYEWVLLPLMCLLALRLPIAPGLMLPLAAYGVSCVMGVRSMSWTLSPGPVVRVPLPIGDIYSRSDEPQLLAWNWLADWRQKHPGSRLFVLGRWSFGGWYNSCRELPLQRNQIFGTGSQTVSDQQRIRESLDRIGVVLMPTDRLQPVAGEALRLLLVSYLPADLAQRCVTDFEVGFVNEQAIVLTRRNPPDSR